MLDEEFESSRVDVFSQRVSQVKLLESAFLLESKTHFLSVKDFESPQLRSHRNVKLLLSPKTVFLSHLAPPISLVEKVSTIEFSETVRLRSEDFATAKGEFRHEVFGVKNDAVLPFVVVVASSSRIEKSCVAMLTLRDPVRVSNRFDVQIVVVVVAPPIEKPTKSGREIAASIASFLLHAQVRHDLLLAQSLEEMQSVVAQYLNSKEEGGKDDDDDNDGDQHLHHSIPPLFIPFQGIVDDARRRLKYYASDYLDGIVGVRNVGKTISAAFFLFFAILLPSIALGQLYSSSTNGVISVQQVLWMQLTGGAVISIFAAQPLIIIMTTAPMALFTKILYIFATSNNVAFLPLYAWTGIFASIFVFLSSAFNAPFLIRYMTAFTEETFSLFISADFIFSSIVYCAGVFYDYYSCSTCIDTRSAALLYLLLCLSSIWLAMTLRRTRDTQFFNTRVRELVSDFALPVAVISISFFGSYVFQSVRLPPFTYSPSGRVFVFTPLLDAPPWVIGASVGFGLILAFLFFVDHLISSAMAQQPSMLLKKGVYYHWDLALTSIVFVISSLFGLPWLTAAVPHCPLHVLALADIEHVVVDGHAQRRVTQAREVRTAALIAHIGIGLCILALPLPLQYIPVPVLYGTLCFMALSSTDGNAFFERAILYVTQSSMFPNRSYLHRLRLKTVHLFTLCQLICWAALCVIAFVPQIYVNLMFPVVLCLIAVVRQLLIPKLFSRNAIIALD